MSVAAFRCGTAALVGRPNVGKSTLLNALIGVKVSITSRKPQTTRHRIRGVVTLEDAQYVFVDTPGFQTRHRSALNTLMNRSVRAALKEVDVAVLVIEAGEFDAEDRDLLRLLPKSTPLILAVNKADRLNREQMVPFLAKAAKEADFAEIVPLSALRKKGMGELLRALRSYLPEQEPMFAADEYTDLTERFIASELVREKLFRLLGDELPYGAGVTIDKFEDLERRDGRLRRIFASIVVEKDNHKAMIVGAGGGKLKEISRSARLDMERTFGGKVYLEVWVKVRSGWTGDTAALKRFGYG